MIVYGYENGRTLRVTWALEEANVEYEYRRVDVLKGGQYAAEFVAINPFRKVPVLVDNDFILTESAAIVTYIGERYPHSKLVPAAGTDDRARYDQWVSFILTEIDAPLWTIAKHRFVYPKDWRVPEAERGAARDLKAALGHIGAHLRARSADSGYLLGQSFSGADIMLAHCISWTLSARLDVVPVDLRDFYASSTERPASSRAVSRLDVSTVSNLDAP